MHNLTSEEQALIEHINEQMRHALEGYVGDPLTPEKLSLMRQAIEKTLEPIQEKQDKFTDHVNFVVDCYDYDHNVMHVHMIPHPNSPSWVYDVFHRIDECLTPH